MAPGLPRQQTTGHGSDTVVCSTGAPQGTVLAPPSLSTQAIFTHYTSDCHLQKFLDDSAVIGLINNRDERELRDLNQVCLHVNTGKTKELVVEFRQHKSCPLTWGKNQGMDIELVDSHKYLDWSDNTRGPYKRGQSRLHLLQ